MARKRNPRGQGAQLRDELLDATEDLLAEHGDERAVTIRAIVERVGVTPPALYLHFDSKGALVREVVLRGFSDLARATSHAAEHAAPQGGPLAALRAGMLAYLQWAEQHPGRYAALFQARRETQLLDDEGSGTSVAFEALVARVRACQQAGLARNGDARRIATLLWAAEHGIATLRATRDRFPWPPAEELIDDLLDGLLGTGATTTPPDDAAACT